MTAGSSRDRTHRHHLYCLPNNYTTNGWSGGGSQAGWLTWLIMSVSFVSSVCKLFNQPKCATSFKLSHFSSLAYGALQSLYCCFFFVAFFSFFLFWVAERWKLVARQSHGHYVESQTSTTAPRSFFTTGGTFSWNVNLCVTSRRENCRIRKNAIWLGVKWYHGDNDDGGWLNRLYTYFKRTHFFFN